MRALVVDDEPVIRDYVCTVLARWGYETVQAADGLEAFELARRHACDLVVADFSMPDMNGGELIAHLQESGYHAHYLLVSGDLAGAPTGVPFLPKPFTPTELIDAIEKLKDENPTDREHNARKARAEWLASMTEMNEIISEVPSSIPAPDGTLLVQKAGHKRATAYQKYRDALDRLYAPGSEETEET